eukprot:TRINITY_DN17216_c0_g1_i4.p1 TRINITY_DN17216_c0_g1~~TRINITY_DN17216_c0_g1_i4.p1  ORF type:complete len:104 (-),score=17.30 TRINITY_DN17216_c0_g1_i4:32-343(-)
MILQILPGNPPVQVANVHSGTLGTAATTVVVVVVVGHESGVIALSLIHISEPTRLLSISYAVFCLKKKKKLHNISDSNLNYIKKKLKYIHLMDLLSLMYDTLI